ncbi:MAG TPA: transcription antitermination factor NusB [Defluviitaleaceae bacterium]|jgi:N utilization substance protein B|nr:transcription antitermination factor NusB [Candidatus Epulonipiscium sp.]HOQ16377.1 transcription antitermination factor NusB [Defluviitaleaceae bacterium]HPT75806.1 transcription antitermination factor NusB [Defluviitaleaceae bacterium]HQD51180.1 transcription antitermination factor NusB [Defluviitaleaceae bacterium]
MSRRRAREHVFILLFQMTFINQEETDERIELYFEQHSHIKEEDKKYITEELKAVLSKLETIDELISQHSKKWKIERMSRVDLSILRLAVFEMQYREDIPNSVAINEAVELAKKYSGDQSPSFVNGVLGSIASSLGEPYDE